MLRCSWKFLLVLLSLGFSPLASAQSGKFQVIGVIAENPIKGRGVTLIKNTETQHVSAFRPGAHLDETTTVEAVFRKYIIIKSSGVRMRLMVGSDRPVESDPAAKAAYVAGRPVSDGVAREGSTVRIQSALKDHLIGDNLSKVLTQAASEPVFKNGSLIGFGLWDIEKGSIFDVAGIQNGDVITRINGETINDAGKAIRILNGLRGANQTEIALLRNNQEQTLTLVIQ